MKIVPRFYFKCGKRYPYWITYVLNDQGIWRRWAVVNHNGTTRRYFPK